MHGRDVVWIMMINETKGSADKNKSRFLTRRFFHWLINKLPELRDLRVNSAHSSSSSKLLMSCAWCGLKNTLLPHAYATSMNRAVRGCYSMRECCLWNEHRHSSSLETNDQQDILSDYFSVCPTCFHLLFWSFILFCTCLNLEWKILA